MKLVIDNQNRNLNDDIVINDCQKDKALDMSNMLDGHKHTLLSLERSDKSRLYVGGGADWCIVTCTTAKNENLTLVNLHGEEDETIELCAGGQFADFPKSIVVNKHMATKVIDSFFEDNESYLEWEKE